MSDAGEPVSADTETNFAVLRDQYAAVNARDWKRAMSHYAEDVELVIPSGIMSGTFEGRDAVGRWFGDWFSTFDFDARFEIIELGELDDGSIFLAAEHHARGRASGVAIVGMVYWRYRFRDGKITHVKGFETREDAVG